MMTKNQKMLLGLGAVAVVGYFVYQNNKPKGFAGEKMNASGRLDLGSFGLQSLNVNDCNGKADGGTSTDAAHPKGTCCNGKVEGSGFRCCKTGKFAEGTLNLSQCGGGATAQTTLTTGGRMGVAY